MLVHPSFDPIAFRLGPLQIHWYGLMYLLAFLSAWGLAMLRQRKKNSGWSSEQVADLIFYGALGVVIGGRVGYMLFYDFSTLLHKPWSLFMLWQGGMSFHGGLIGVIASLWLFAKRFNKPFLAVTDFVAPLVPLGLAFGRLGNFINGELWGRATTVSWGMIFPQVDTTPRHPSQLYEFFLEGIVLFIALWLYTQKPRALGRPSGWFLIGYGSARIIVEFFREPDRHIGFLAFHQLTMGQLLCLPMLAVGLFLLLRSNACSNTLN